MEGYRREGKQFRNNSMFSFSYSGESKFEFYFKELVRRSANEGGSSSSFQRMNLFEVYRNKFH